MEGWVVRLSASHSVGLEAEGLARQLAAAVERGGGELPSHPRLSSAHLSLHAATALSTHNARAPSPFSHRPPLGDAMLHAANHACASAISSPTPLLTPISLPLSRCPSLPLSFAEESARRGIPAWLLSRASWPMRIEVRGSPSPSLASLSATIEGAFSARVELEAMSRECGGDVIESAWLPTRLAIGASDESFPLGALSLPSSLLFRELSTRAGAVMASLSPLPLSHQLEWLVRYLSSLHNLFRAPCAHCGQCLLSSNGPSALLPPTVRSPSLKPYHPSCFLSSHGVSVERAFERAIQEAASANLPPPPCEENRQPEEGRVAQLTEAVIVNALKEAGGRLSLAEIHRRFRGTGADAAAATHKLVSILERVGRTMTENDVRYVGLKAPYA